MDNLLSGLLDSMAVAQPPQPETNPPTPDSETFRVIVIRDKMTLESLSDVQPLIDRLGVPTGTDGDDVDDWEELNAIELSTISGADFYQFRVREIFGAL